MTRHGWWSLIRAGSLRRVLNVLSERLDELRAGQELFRRLDRERCPLVVARVACYEHIRTDVDRAGSLEAVLEDGGQGVGGNEAFRLSLFDAS